MASREAAIKNNLNDRARKFLFEMWKEASQQRGSCKAIGSRWDQHEREFTVTLCEL
jgi:hypothetical protein